MLELMGTHAIPDLQVGLRFVNQCSHVLVETLHGDALINQPLNRPTIAIQRKCHHLEIWVFGAIQREVVDELMHFSS